MTVDQGIAMGLLVGAMLLFASGKLRYDMVALVTLFIGVLAGIVPIGEAYLGFGHPAVITVAAVLILSHALTVSGAVDYLAAMVAPATEKSTFAHIGVLGGVSAVLSTFMNNVGALALMLPVAVNSAAKVKRSPAAILMPISFASILGGMVTLIGTPPNLIVANYRGTTEAGPFSMFDFAPVGAPVALIGIGFVALVGWRLIPRARRERMPPTELFDIGDYVTEVRLTEDSPLAGKSMFEIERELGKEDLAMVGVVRNEQHLFAARAHWPIKPADILIVQGAPDAIDKVTGQLGLKLVGRGEEITKGLPKDYWSLAEAIVSAGSVLLGRTPEGFALRSRFEVNLLAVSRQGRPYRGRLKDFRFRVGDVLLLQGPSERLPEVIGEIGCLPLADRGIAIGRENQALLSVVLFGGGIGLAAAGLLSAPVALGLAAMLCILTGIIKPDEAYKAIDWRIVVLLGAFIPVGTALDTTGATDLIARQITSLQGVLPTVVILGVVMVVTMTLSDVINNAATAVVMAPLASAIAGGLSVNADPFLMAVAIGASCAFLTPIGHQNNTLVLGPGGYKFGDYWRLGLPVEIIIVAVSLPLLLIVWPL